VIGLAIAAPVGPIGVLCIRRTLADGRLIGLLTGLGAATADGVYGAIAAFGLTAVSDLLIGQGPWLGLIGGLFLCYLGVRTFMAVPAGPAAPTRSGALLAIFSSTFVLTLTNPTTILSFVAIFAGLGLGDTGGDYFAASLMVSGVFLGSALWWVGLSGTVSVFRTRVGPRGLRAINRLSGLLIGGFGVGALALAALGLV
jgi:threonine/homoserine/homoserine lactone efflux protein